MQKYRHRLVAISAASVIGLALSGCAAGVEKTIEYTALSLTLAQGEALAVDLGKINPSVGDAWAVTRTPIRQYSDPATDGRAIWVRRVRRERRARWSTASRPSAEAPR